MGSGRKICWKGHARGSPASCRCGPLEPAGLWDGRLGVQKWSQSADAKYEAVQATVAALLHKNQFANIYMVELMAPRRYRAQQNRLEQQQTGRSQHWYAQKAIVTTRLTPPRVDAVQSSRQHGRD
jgi:hypothetical protein